MIVRGGVTAPGYPVTEPSSAEDPDDAHRDDAGTEGRCGGDGGNDERSGAVAGIGEQPPGTEEHRSLLRGCEVCAEGHQDARAHAVATPDRQSYDGQARTVVVAGTRVSEAPSAWTEGMAINIRPKWSIILPVGQQHVDRAGDAEDHGGWPSKPGGQARTNHRALGAGRGHGGSFHRK